MISIANCGRAIAAIILLCASPAAAECYHKPNDKTETITEADSGGTLIWKHGKRRIAFETGGAGTGIEYRMACDKNAKCFRYEFKGINMIFGSVTYAPGCK